MTLVRGLPQILNPQNRQQNMPSSMQTGYGNNLPVKSIQALANKQPVTQGSRLTMSQGANPFTVTLVIPGQRLLGISINTATLTDIADTYLTMNINGFNSLLDVNLLQICPLANQGMLFFPLDLALVGNDTFKLAFQKNDAGNINAGFNIHYAAQ